ncbi:MAG: hypothetical protein LBM87_04520 [Ruminococcus sp.]|jgi:hypothetical protein|nr:hypothetical protein [Ruminococcus sp.]
MIKFAKGNFLILLTAVAAAVTALFAPVATFPANQYLGQIAIIFGFYIVWAAFDGSGLLSLGAKKIRGNKNSSAVMIIITAVSFLFGGIFTPYAAVIFVLPTAFKIFNRKTRLICFPVISAAALFGSFLSPFSTFGAATLSHSVPLDTAQFYENALPFALIGFIAAAAAAMFIKKEYSDAELSLKSRPEPVYIGVFILLFILCVLAVNGIIDTIAAFASICIVAVILEPALFKKADYCGLICLFLLSIAAWNLMRTPLFDLSDSNFLSVVFVKQMIGDNTAMFAFGRGVAPDMIFKAIHIGSVGSLAASPVNLISYGLYVTSPHAKPFLGLLSITVFNAVFTGLMILFGFIFA